MSKANYIICVHKDLDGICCAAIILQHYPDAKVFFSPQGSVQNIFNRLKNYLRNYVQNNFFICDISSDSSSVKHIKKIMNKYVKEFDLHVIWIDHHDWDKSDKISDDIEVILEPTSKSAAKLVQKYFNSHSDSVYVKIAEGEFVRYKFYWTTVIQNVCKKLYYDENLGYVLRAFCLFEPNEKTDEFYIVPQELSEEELDSIPVFKTHNGYKFAILEMENIEHEIKWQKEAYRIMKHHRCDFICTIFENGEYSFWSRTKIDLRFLEEHGAVGHLDNSFHINIPYIKWKNTDFHRPITKEELIEVLIDSNVIYETNHQSASLDRQNIDIIPHLRQLPSMSERIFNILFTREITGLKELLLCDDDKLKKFGVPFESSIDLKKEALEVLKKNGFNYESGDNLKKSVEGHLILKSGCSSLDTILGGGFFSQKLYELYGLPNTGKTLMIHQLLCQAILSSQSQGLRVPVVYIDTEKHFSPEIIRSIALRLNLDPNYVFRNIARLEVNSAEQLVQVVEEKLIQFIEKYGVRIILVDNIITPFFEDYDGIETIPKRQGKLAGVLQALINLSEKYKTAVIITNKTVKDDKNNGGYQHAGGTVMGYVQVRIAIKYVEDEINVRRFDIEKAVDKSEITCILSISSQGFYNTNYVIYFLKGLYGLQGNFA